ncbi:hypothetical protein AB1K83_00470 [Sporosarcina sp. 179-K 3D1 HS]|uniref:hypothetical protein n=1 Tax=Sporosarcina sp. 179-K 3D1 HS TaxID=3232169 RepID=UPI0039A04149
MELAWTFGKILLGIAIISVIVNYRFHLKDKKILYSKKLIPPIWADRETKQLFQQFNRAWSYKIEKNVNVRIHKSKHSLTDQELRERWYELKKFLLLASVSKGLPMFSKKVDDIWHFFLEEQVLYEEFCYRFIGEPIEHHPHEKPKHLPKERAWFDLLYLSFFPVSSHSHLWGDFLQEKEEHGKWIVQIINGTEDIKNTHGRHRASAPTVETLDAFLQFAKEQVDQPNPNLKKRIQQTDGYWYGPAILGVGVYEGHNFYEDQKKRQDGFGGDGGASGYSAGSDERNDERIDAWNETASDVNTFEAGSGGIPSNSGGWTGSDSGSGCSSCSSCSGCSS